MKARTQGNVIHVDFQPQAVDDEPEALSPEQLADLATIAAQAVTAALKGALRQILESAATKYPMSRVADASQAFLAELRAELAHLEQANPFKAAL